MNCINVKVNHIKNPLNITIKRDDQIKVETNCLNKQLHIEINKVNDILNVSCHITCTAVHNKHLTVVPNIIWLTHDELNTAMFDIYSNVVWKID